MSWLPSGARRNTSRSSSKTRSKNGRHRSRPPASSQIEKVGGLALALTPWRSPGSSDQLCVRRRRSSPVRWHERRGAFVLDQEHQEFRRIGSACVPVNDVNIVRALIEALSWCQCYLLSTLQLHHNGALQHVNKRMCIVSVDGARPAWRMLYCDHHNFLAGILRKIFGHERRDLGLLSHRRAAHEA